MRVGIVGGGMMGLVAAEKLTADGHSVHVYERAEQVGGLATWHDFGGFDWDRFYHVILPTDTHLVEFVERIGLDKELRWQTTRTGVYVDDQFHSVSSTREFLRFPPLSMWSKFRLALTILYCASIRDWRRLESVTVEDWLLRTSGRATYEKFWKPLLLAKVGESYKRVSAVFIWTYITRLYSARSSTAAQKEQLGHVSGGYKRVLQRVVELITSRGGGVHTGTTVGRVESAGDRGIALVVDGRREAFDKVIFTGPVNVLQQLAAKDLVQHEDSGAKVEYLGVICVVLVTERPIVPYYTVNIADPEIPFTGVIGTSNVVAPSETGGLHMTYLPKYVLSTDPFLQRPSDEIETEFLAGLKRMLPEWESAGLVSVHVNRAIKVQPLQVLNYSQLIPRIDTQHPDFYVLNTARFVNNTLNNNEVVRLVDGFFEQYGGDFGPDLDAAPATLHAAVG